MKTTRKMGGEMIMVISEEKYPKQVKGIAIQMDKN